MDFCFIYDNFISKSKLGHLAAIILYASTAQFNILDVEGQKFCRNYVSMTFLNSRLKSDNNVSIYCGSSTQIMLKKGLVQFMCKCVLE